MHAILPYIESVTNELKALPSLHPSPRVNRCFGCLVDVVIHTSDEVGTQIAGTEWFSSTASSVRSYCSVGETLLEFHWVQHFLNMKELSYSSLEQFPYMENYEKLAALEVGILKQYTSERHITFIGGGPLPLSAIVLAAKYGYRVTVIDLDPEAVKKSRMLVHKLGLSQSISILESDARTCIPTTSAIILGALVGETIHEKEIILTHLADTCVPGGIILARSVKGLSELLYPPVPLVPSLKALGCVRGTRDVINTVEVFRIQSGT